MCSSDLFENPELWRQLDFRVHTRFAGQESFTSTYLSLFDQVGNNARYGLDLRTLDPFAPYRCPDVPVSEYTASTGELMVQAPVELYFTVNGRILTPGDTLFAGTYWDYAANPFREENCQ